MTDPTPDTHLRSPRNPVTFIDWIIASLIVWIIGGIITGIITARLIRGRNHHYARVCDHGHPEIERWSGCDGPECWYGHPIPHQPTPSPNHPTMRAHQQLTEDKPYDPGPPLTPAQTAALDQLQEDLR